jgi:excisionase family DNA binding protein
MERAMPTRNEQAATKRTAPLFATVPLPLEPFSVRIPVAVQLTGIGRSKLYELIAAGEIETVKVGASTLVTVASLRSLIQKRRRA